MSTFLVERYWPGVTRPALDAAVDRLQQVLLGSPPHGPVAHVASLLVDADEVVFCLFSATSPEAVEAVNERADFPFDRIVEGTWLSRASSQDTPTRRSRRRRDARTLLPGLGIACALLLGACGAGAQIPPVASPGSGGATAASHASATPKAPAVLGSQATVDQCSFLTTAEIETATGQKVVGSKQESGTFGTCVWTLSRKANQIRLTVYLDDPDAAKEQAFRCKAGFGLKPVDGLGDSACGDAGTSGYGEYWLHVLRDDDRVTLNGGLFDHENYAVKPTVWATLARAVLAKLP
jgi:hypothetical protein